ncbi:uncharacterized protein LOC127624671 isoform X2 [Xyrauchen texanus]|uniref:uncharacterized protein LOC127624671 isoform X2 n=1 Tax=Xyrauchen texanus TaxID=154827 RepID=UPI0022418BED|nr:uncharacterized protein LOC127624671 isoform X2 [Xyrauchen texanus]XP_051955462.1 uncharacterized protein LOC127624671 isoform X2 [Xyrauchen texanus]
MNDFQSLFELVTPTDITVSFKMMTLFDQTKLTCCDKGQPISECVFYTDSKYIAQNNSTDHCCELIVSGKELVQNKTGKQLQTTVNVHCMTKPHHGLHQNVTITVWRLSLSGEQTLVVLVILGTLILVFLLMIITQIVYMAKQQGCRRKFSPARAQNLDTGTQDANPGPAEKQETVKTEVVEDELLYATVNHLAENSVLAVKFESGTDYATVVIN